MGRTDSREFRYLALLRAVDAVDVLRGDLNDSADGAPPQLRTDLLKLHQLAMAAFNEDHAAEWLSYLISPWIFRIRLII